MAEYISREEVINAIKSLESSMPAKDNYAKGYDAALGRVLIAVRAVPPSADVQSVNQWISCKDKIPEEYKTVLVYEKDYGVMIGELEKKFFDTQYFIARKSGMILRTTEVTHWQPLPKPPQD